MTDIKDTPYSVLLLVDLYNLQGDDWPKEIRNEVRHELRKYGYSIQTEDYYVKHTKAVYKEN